MTDLRTVVPGPYVSYLQLKITDALRAIQDTEAARLRGDDPVLWPVPSFVLTDAEPDAVLSLTCHSASGSPAPL